MPQRDEAKDYWLSEGFTDFYTARLLLKDKIWTLKEYVDSLNDALRDYAYSPLRSAPNSKIISDFWTDQDAQKLPYLRGHLFAHLIDHMLRQDSEGERDFDDIMSAMRERVRALGSAEPPLATAMFAEEMKKAELDISDLIASHIRDGKPILLPEDTFVPCGVVETNKIPAFDRGFDPDKTAENGNVIVGLREGSNGYKAGLRNGMKIVKRESGKTGDSRVPLVYRVLDNGKERVVSFLPEGQKRVTLQELILDEDLSDKDRKNCVARLSGMPGWFTSGIWSKLKKWVTF